MLHLVKESANKIKEKIQSKTLHFPKNKKIVVYPLPIYKNQLADAQKEKIEKFYGKIDDKKAALKFGAKNIKEFSFWAWRSCGIACLQMILKNNKKTMELVNDGIRKNGYIFKNDIGWKHQALVKILKEYDFNAKITRVITPFDIALNIRKNRYVILSVKSKTGGHMILIFGLKTDEKGKIKEFYYFDPMEKPESKFPKLDFQRLKQISKKQGIFVWKKE